MCARVCVCVCGSTHHMLAHSRKSMPRECALRVPDGETETKANKNENERHRRTSGFARMNNVQQLNAHTYVVQPQHLLRDGGGQSVSPEIVCCVCTTTTTTQHSSTHGPMSMSASKYWTFHACLASGSSSRRRAWLFMPCPNTSKQRKERAQTNSVNTS